MDQAEWQAAYRRATMDDGTMRDYIEDLMLQRDALNRQVGDLEAEVERLRTALSELANRFSAQEAKHFRIIRSLEAERDQWQRQAMSNG